MQIGKSTGIPGVLGGARGCSGVFRGVPACRLGEARDTCKTRISADLEKWKEPGNGRHTSKGKGSLERRHKDGQRSEKKKPTVYLLFLLSFVARGGEASGEA